MIQRSSTLITTAKRSSNFSNPVVNAMLSANTMNDCDEVRDMLLHCRSSGHHNKSVICDTATRYYDICTRTSDGTKELEES